MHMTPRIAQYNVTHTTPRVTHNSLNGGLRTLPPVAIRRVRALHRRRRLPLGPLTTGLVPEATAAQSLENRGKKSSVLTSPGY